MVVSLVTAFPDIQFEIFKVLSLGSLVILRQVCRSLNTAIMSNKQLWISILERDVLSRGINLHPLRISKDEASVQHVESWIRCALSLSRAHREERRPITTHVKLELRVTWLKILRINWCIVASSSERESRLTIWNLQGGSPAISKEYYLPGPVGDGVVDDGGSGITLALTIGTTNMFVHVLSVCEIDRAASICSLAILRDVSYVRSLNGRWIVCAVRQGDDTYPTLVDWTTSRQWALSPRWYIDHPNLPWGVLHSAVLVATQWLDCIVVIMSKTVEIFRIADLQRDSKSVSSVASFRVIIPRTHVEDNTDGADLEEAMFHTYGQCKTPDGHPILSFTCRTKTRSYSLFSIIFSDPNFTLLEGSLNVTKNLRPHDFPSGGSSFAVGRASNYEVHLRIRDDYELLPELIFVKIDRFCEDNALLSASCPRAVTDEFPLLHFTTSMDFDDVTGLLVVGTCKGRLCFARFIPEEMIASGSLMDELPAQSSRGDELSIASIDMDIPPYFIHAQKSKYDFALPSQYIEETVETWPPLPRGSLASGPWSNDWSQYENLRHWVVPANRWPMIDVGGFYHVDSIVPRIRLVMDTLGDVIPLAYRLNPEIVVYRIGPRYYMVTVTKDVLNMLNFEDMPLPNLDVTSPLQSEFFEALTRSNVQPHPRRFGKSGEVGLFHAAKWVDRLLEVVAQNAEELKIELSEIGPDPNFWSEDDFIMIVEKVTYRM
ncbi:hypothetical protein SCHPADRAFT_855527 [Schizopora paradoxa]|uniref:F-box domain-containing protein n=1 Tax=Schizopora paradoxa TaxID=27342 RepID=A0A0H2RI62_9AGAM|nr:hypothetical protein SCHPADRAFT_855527 [Schizopora paradoxa]